MLKFPSPEWLNEFARVFYESKDESEAGKTWKGGLCVAVLPDQPEEKPRAVDTSLGGGQPSQNPSRY